MTDGEGSNDEVLSEGKIASSFLLAMTEVLSEGKIASPDKGRRDRNDGEKLLTINS